MLVLMDMEWVDDARGKRHLTQLAAVRVDGAWEERDRFGSLVCPDSEDVFRMQTVGFNGHSEEAFRGAPRESGVMEQVSLWLEEADLICFWHSDANTYFMKMWKECLASAPEPQTVCLEKLIHRSKKMVLKTGRNLYGVAMMLNMAVSVTHCSEIDVELMRNVLPALDVQQSAVYKQRKKNAEYDIRSMRNRNMIHAAEYNYLYTPDAKIFHCRNCRCMLKARVIWGCIRYETAAKERRPCLVCRPEPIPVAKKETQENKKKEARKRTHDTLIEAKLLGGERVRIKRKRIVGVCHSPLHPGMLTEDIMEKHRCQQKHCRMFEKNGNASYWRRLEQEEREKELRRQSRRDRKEAERSREQASKALRELFQCFADETECPLDIIRVEEVKRNVFKVYYVSDSPFCDGKDYPEFVEAIRKSYPGWSVLMRHIRDMDGYYVTREEFYARKR